jgi:hypothetical protein
VNGKSSVPGEYIAPVTGEYGFYRVTDPNHWVFAGTGLAQGDEFGREDSIVGVECDGGDIEFVDGRPRFTGQDGISQHYQILAIGDTEDADLNNQLGIIQDRFYATVAINETQFKGTIFTAATIEWAHGLYRDKENVVSRITRNVLDRLGKHG